MIKFLITTLFTLLTTSVFAATSCPQAVPIDNAGFCPSFKSVAECHCTASGLPSSMCQNMDTVYNRMIALFGTVQRACEYQHDTTTQSCLDDWSCYLNGGKDSQGKLCSGSGISCK